jgi:hypothetical protein
MRTGETYRLHHEELELNDLIVEGGWPVTF